MNYDMATLTLQLSDDLIYLQHFLYLKVLSYCNQVPTNPKILMSIMNDWGLPLPCNFDSYEHLSEAFSFNYDEVKFLTSSGWHSYVVKPQRSISTSIIPISVNQSFRQFLYSKWMMDYDLSDFDEATFGEFINATLRVIEAVNQISSFLILVTSVYENVDSLLAEDIQICKPVVDNIKGLLAPIGALVERCRKETLNVSQECLRPQLLYIRGHIYKMIFICLLYDYSSTIEGMTAGMQSFIGALQEIMNKCLASAALHKIVFSKSSINAKLTPDERGEGDNTTRIKMYFEYTIRKERTKIVVLRVDMPHKGVGSVHLNICGSDCTVEKCMNHKTFDIIEEDTLILIEGFYDYIMLNIPELIITANDRRTDEEYMLRKMEPYVYSRYYFATHKIDELSEEKELEDEFRLRLGFPEHSTIKQLTEFINQNLKYF